MLNQVRPGLYFWCYLGHFSSIAGLFSSLKMDFLNKITAGLVANIFLRLTIILSWFVVNVLLYNVFRSFLDKPRANRFFGGYERVGKTVGSALLFFGNIGLYYYSEKSIACMLSFLFLALYCLCTLFCIQPYTDFGVFEFLLSASLNQALSLFGLHSYSSWVVLIACMVMAGLRYWLEPVQHGSNPNLTLPVQLRTDIPTLQNLALPENDDHDTNLPTWEKLMNVWENSLSVKDGVEKINVCMGKFITGEGRQEHHRLTEILDKFTDQRFTGILERNTVHRSPAQFSKDVC